MTCRTRENPSCPKPTVTVASTRLLQNRARGAGATRPTAYPRSATSLSLSRSRLITHHICKVMKKTKVTRPLNSKVRVKPSRKSGRPRKAVTTFPEENEVAESHRNALTSFVDAQSAELVAYAQQAATCVKEATIKDLASGAVPSRAENASELERELYTRATIQARHSPYLEGGLALEGLRTLLLIHELNDSVGWSAFNTSVALAQDLRNKLTPDEDQKHWQVGSTVEGMTLLFLAVPDWYEVAVIAMRDLILVELFKDQEAVRKIGLRFCEHPAKQRAPIWICPSRADGTPRKGPSRRKSAKGTRSRAKL